jgi:FkbM family methyltransferase
LVGCPAAELPGFGDNVASETRMFADWETRGRRFVAARRERTPIRWLHRFAAIVESGYENEEWDMDANGETGLLRRLAPARLRTVFDVGAHCGDWSVEALNAFNEANVHAFEVAPPTFDRLQREITARGLAHRTTLNAFGLGDRTGSREMYFFPDHPQLTCDMPRHAHAASTPFTAELTTGDDYVRTRGLDGIDFLKIDVEGAEHLVLKGFRQTLDACRIDCIQFEYGAFSIQTRVLLADYYDALGTNYWIGKIFPGSVEFREYDWTMENFRFSNFLCVLRRRPDLMELARGSG